jgi:prophage regulatory protein
MTYTDQSNMLPEKGFLRLPQVLKIVPVGKSTWWAGVKSGRYPKGQKLSPRTTAWKVEDIRALIAELGNEGGNA